MDNFILTVLIAAYNHEQYIRQTLDGVLNQKTSYQFKIVITDDASKDRTQAIIQEYIEKFPERIIPVFNHENIGLNATLKKAIPLLDTKYTCILGGDDYWIDERKVEKEVGFLEENPDTTYVHTGLKHWVEDKNTWGSIINHWEWNMPKERDKRLISFLNHDFTYYPCTSTCCFRTDVMMKCYNNFPQYLDNTLGEGMLIHVAMCMYGEKFHYIPDLTTVYRVRSNSLSHYTDIRELLKYRMGYPKRKIYTFELFKIAPSRYKRVINNNLDDLFLLAYSKKATDCFKKELLDLGIIHGISNKYIMISSYGVLSIIYYQYLKLRDLFDHLLYKGLNLVKK